MFYRLFELFEDECHKLDLEMASQMAPQAGDGHTYSNHCDLVHEERSLLDQKAAAEENVKWLDQVVSLLTLTVMDGDPSTDEPLKDAIELSGEKKKTLKDIVGYFYFLSVLVLVIYTCQGDEIGRFGEEENTAKEGGALRQESRYSTRIL